MSPSKAKPQKLLQVTPSSHLKEKPPIFQPSFLISQGTVWMKPFTVTSSENYGHQTTIGSTRRIWVLPPRFDTSS
jgi:hypothetical protein